MFLTDINRKGQRKYVHLSSPQSLTHEAISWMFTDGVTTEWSQNSTQKGGNKKRTGFGVMKSFKGVFKGIPVSSVGTYGLSDSSQSVSSNDIYP